MPTVAQPRRPRYGAAYWNRRRSVVASLTRLVPMRMRAVPVPRRADDGLERREARRPMELRVRLVRGGVEDGGIAGTARAERPRNLASGDARDGVDDFAHRMRMTGAEVVRARLPRLDDRLERFHVRVGEIGHVHVVAQAGAVGRRVVVAEHGEARPAGR